MAVSDSGVPRYRVRVRLRRQRTDFPQVPKYVKGSSIGSLSSGLQIGWKVLATCAKRQFLRVML